MTTVPTRSDSSKGWRKGVPLRFVLGHQNRGRKVPTRWKWQDCPQCGERFHAPKRKFCSDECVSAAHSGANNHAYNGGLSNVDGRCYIKCADGSLLAYARAVVEAHLRRPLRSDEIVHHRNGDFTDDRIENLEVVTRAEHLAIHRSEFESARKQAATRANTGRTQTPEARAKIGAAVRARRAAERSAA